MKVVELQEMAVPQAAPALKDKRLRALLTPENIKDHYELVIRLIAGKYSIGDLDEIAAIIGNNVPVEEDLEFNMRLIGKRLPAATYPKRRTHGKYEAWYGKLVNPWHSPTSKLSIDRYYEIGYKSGKWFVSFDVSGVGFAGKNKKFDTPKDALTYFERALARLEANPEKW